MHGMIANALLWDAFVVEFSDNIFGKWFPPLFGNRENRDMLDTIFLFNEKLT